MITNADIGKYSLKTTQHEDLQVWALSTANTVNLATVGDDGSFVEGKSFAMEADAISIIVATNYHFSQEAMLEAMAIATEARVKVLYELELSNQLTKQRATGAAMDCTAIVCGHDRRYQYCGKHTKWGELIGKMCVDSLREAIKSAASSLP